MISTTFGRPVHDQSNAFCALTLCLLFECLLLLYDGTDTVSQISPSIAEEWKISGNNKGFQKGFKLNESINGFHIKSQIPPS